MAEWNWAIEMSADSDGIFVLIGLPLMLLGVWVLGQGNSSQGPLADGIGGIWTAVNFGLATTFLGAALILGRVAYAGDLGYGITDDAEIAGWIGIVAMVCATISGASLAMIDRGPKVIGNWVGVAVGGLLFAQSIAASGMVPVADTFLGMDLPIWPMNAILAGIFAIIHGVAVAMLFGDVIANTRKLVD